MKPSVAPHAALRRIVGIAIVGGFLIAAIVLLWSDRAANSFGDVINFTIRAGRKVERDYGVDLVDRADIPAQPDQIGHAAFWGTGMFLIGWVLRRRVPIVLTGLFVGGLSLFFELAQPTLSRTRGIEPSDATANLLGVFVASIVLLAVVSAWRRVVGDDRRYSGDQVHPEDESTDELLLRLD